MAKRNWIEDTDAKTTVHQHEIPAQPPTALRCDESDPSREIDRALRRYNPEIVLMEPPADLAEVASLADFCAAFDMRLHLIQPEVPDAPSGAADCGYWRWKTVRYAAHGSWAAFLSTRPSRRLVFVESGNTHPMKDAEFEPGDILVFSPALAPWRQAFLDDTARGHPVARLTLSLSTSSSQALGEVNAATIVGYQAWASLQGHPL